MISLAKRIFRTCTSLSLLLLFVTSSLSAERVSEALSVVEELVVSPGLEGTGASIDQQAVRARLKTKQGDFFSQTYFDEDLKNLAEEYHRVEPQIEFNKGKVFITLRVWPKPLIRSIAFSGNDKLADKNLQKELDIQPQSLFDRKKFNEAFRKVQAYYVKKGYFEAELSYKVEADESSNEVDIVVTVNEGRAGKISQILFTNFSSDEEFAVSRMIYTKKFHLIRSLMGPEGTYHPEMIDQDRLQVTQYLHDNGYPDARVEIVIKDAKQSNRIIVEFVADKGEAYSFGEISFEGNTLFDDEQIEALIQVKCGEPYSPGKMRETSQRLGDLYGRKGYVDAYVAFEPNLDPDTLTYDVHFVIHEAEMYRVGLIKVFGNDCTDTSVILHETLLTPGDVFNMEKLRATEQRLGNIGYFEHVNVYAVKSEESALLGGDYRDVYIEVEEQSTGNFAFSAGYSTTDSIFGSVAITEKNFNLAGISDIPECGYQAVRGGGEYLFIRTAIGERSKSLYTSWAKPHFFDTPWTLGVDGEMNHTKRAQSYSMATYGGSIFGKYTVNQFLRLGLHYRLKHSELEDVDDKASDALKAEAANQGLVSAVGASLVYNSTDHPVRPTRGLRSELFTEYAGVGGDHDFWSIGYLNSYYIPLWDCICPPYWFPNFLKCGGVIRLRGDVRFKKPLNGSSADSLPLDERYFLGGEGSVRGYRPFSLGPKFDNSSDPKGGISSWLYTAEYNQCINDMVEGFVFIDGGHVSQKEFGWGRFESAYGFGVRLSLMQGLPPLTLGMGYPINEKDPATVKKFFFAMGGSF